MTESSEDPKALAPTAKQVVFLFMAATGVAVVVFLFGVFVGRGGSQSAGASQSNVYPGFQEELLPAVLETRSGEPSAVAIADDQLSYPQRLQSDDPVEETLPSGTNTRHVASSVDADIDVSRSFASDATSDFFEKDSVSDDGRIVMEEDGADDAVGQARDSGSAYTVQVAALRSPEAAEQVAGHLIAKGFPAYVLEPSPAAPVSVYRVRVGRYAEHQDAENIRQRLEREEDFKPWITQ